MEKAHIRKEDCGVELTGTYGFSLSFGTRLMGYSAPRMVITYSARLKGNSNNPCFASANFNLCGPFRGLN
ncbi:Hypothetical protein NTJ_01342 [Nesidiocoris tenuis]|uniref:Uncharacterized protein n=1 Tax=Nesidiocoris tenuis TaxID=355587 RepID=A0ABN7A8B7_9HEMI|nr:Hypothetical protein NTJ_01342 [Nesidiocoris tenuis]